MIPEQKTVWLVTESQINYAQDINEWTETKPGFVLPTKDWFPKLNASTAARIHGARSFSKAYLA